MYIHRVLRTQFFGSRRTCLARLRHVWLAEVAMLFIYFFQLMCYVFASYRRLLLSISPVCVLTHRNPPIERCAPRAMRWDWQRRLPRSTATQLQPFSPKWLTKASLQTSFMKMRRYIWSPETQQCTVVSKVSTAHHFSPHFVVTALFQYLKW